MVTPLEELAVVADEAADDQRRVARRARAVQRQREAGWPWTKILDDQQEPGLLELLRRTSRRLADQTVHLASHLAEELAGEGESRRQIARRLGVSHQRVSAMLERRRAGNSS